VRLNVLKEEVAYYVTLLEPEDTGHIRTAISFLCDRIEHLEGKRGWPFDKSDTSM
jgi:hypothetical protein